MPHDKAVDGHEPAPGPIGPPAPPVPSLASQFRAHFAGSGTLYEVLLDHFADDLEAGGITADICQDWTEAAREEVVHLRLLAALFRVVLRGDAPQLVRYYPCLGGDSRPDGCWPDVADVVAARATAIRAALTVTPQTNEVGRSAPLLIALFEAVRRRGICRVRLLEPGASAGLNLNVDRYLFTGPGWSAGPPGSRLRIDTLADGVRPEPMTIVERRGCDLSPVDPASGDGALRLRSYVWPWQLDRHARLVAALAIVRERPVAVDRASAADWLTLQLAAPAAPGTLTVVWHSITRQYWPAAETARVAEIIDAARSRMPLAHVSMEDAPTRSGQESRIPFDWPQLRLDGELVARCHYHGPPVVLTTAERAGSDSGAGGPPDGRR